MRRYADSYDESAELDHWTCPDCQEKFATERERAAKAQCVGLGTRRTRMRTRQSA